MGEFALAIGGPFLAEPALTLPPDMSDALRDALQAKTFTRNNVHGQTTREDLDYEKLEVWGARFLPAALMDATRRRLVDLASRDTEAKYWAAFAASEMLLAATPAECRGFAGLRERSRLATDDDAANTWCLQLELLHAPAEAQLDTLLAVRECRFFTDLMAVIRPTTDQQLLDFLAANAAQRDRAARVVMEVMGYQESPASLELAQSLVDYLDCSDPEVKAIAFVALSKCAPEACGRALLGRNWRPSDQDPFLAHHASPAVTAASIHLRLDDVLYMVAPWRWLDAAVTRGAQPEELAEASERLLTVLGATPGVIPEFNGRFAAQSVVDGDPLRISVAEVRGAEDLHSVVDRLNESAEAANQRRRVFSEQAAASIQTIRTQGHSLYLQSFSKSSVEAAYLANPAVWQRALEGLSPVTPEFLRRIHAAEGLYVALCEVLLRHDPDLGASMWRVLRQHQRTKFVGEADVPELLHMLFRVPESAAVLALREERASLASCHTDAALMDLVIAAESNGQDKWLEAFIARDIASGSHWRLRRALVLNALHAAPPVDQLQWPSGELLSTWGVLEARMTEWTNRAALAMHWWGRYVTADSCDAAWAAWHVLLSCADRRAWSWLRRVAKTATVQDPELSRLLDLQFELNLNHVRQKLKKREEKLNAFSSHLFGHDTPIKWLMLDDTPP